MSKRKRSIIAIVTVVVVAAVMWLGGHALWDVILAMHGRR
jgi:uncharacterized membrane protein